MDLFLSFPGAQSPCPPSSLAQDVCRGMLRGRLRKGPLPPETGKFYLQWSATGVRKGTVVTVNNSGRVRGLTRPCRGLQACGEEARDAAPAFPGCVLMPPVAAPPPRLPRSGGVWTPPDHCQSPMSGSKRVNGRVGIDSGFCVNVIDPGG